MIAQVAQRVAHFGPKAVHPLGIGIGNLHFGQQMRAAAQIKPKVH